MDTNPEAKRSGSKKTAVKNNRPQNSHASRWMSVADPVHGIIRFDRNDETHRLLLDIINSRSFQRLRRIRQMGMAEFVFPGATHSRFVHSLGATHLMIQWIDHQNHGKQGRDLLSSPYEDTGIPLERLLLVAILTHDIGHTPLSHTLEDILELEAQNLLHDQYWNAKILKEDKDLCAIWQKYNPGLPDAVISFMGQKPGHEKHFLAQLVSSQLDMDRLDYLQRDSHFLGVQYGRIEGDRLIANMELAKLPDGTPVIACREEAIPAIEHYLFGRHQAYKMAMHPLDKASESLLKKAFDRFRYVKEHNIMGHSRADLLYQLMTDGRSLTIDQYLELDDCYLWQSINHWARQTEDPLLNTLANRVLRHDLLKFADLTKFGYADSLTKLPVVYDALQAHYQKRGLSFELGYEQIIVRPKPLYKKSRSREPIWIRTSRGTVVDLSQATSLPLHEEPANADDMRGLKNLVFVWDKKAKHFLLDMLEEQFPDVTDAADLEDDDEAYL